MTEHRNKFAELYSFISDEATLNLVRNWVETNVVIISSMSKIKKKSTDKFLLEGLKQRILSVTDSLYKEGFFLEEIQEPEEGQFNQHKTSLMVFSWDQKKDDRKR